MENIKRRAFLVGLSSTLVGFKFGVGESDIASIGAMVPATISWQVSDFDHGQQVGMTIELRRLGEIHRHAVLFSADDYDENAGRKILAEWAADKLAELGWEA